MSMENIEEILEINKGDGSNNSINNKTTFLGYLSFDHLISVNIIMIVYLIGAFVLTITGIFIILKEIFFIPPLWETLYDLGLFGLLNINAKIGWLILIFGNVFWRLICESWIILFRISESLTNIEKQKYE